MSRRKTHRIKGFIAVFLLAALLIAPLRRLGASGPFFETATFFQNIGPDFPQIHYVQGDLGVIQPTYRRRFLVIAYRYLAGPRFSPREQQALEAALNPNAGHNRPNLIAQGTEQDAIATWNAARKEVIGAAAPPKIEVYRGGFFSEAHYIGYLNCPSDTFRNAAATLRRRTKQFGPHNPLLREWVKAQDAVFSNCDSPAALPYVEESWLSPEQKAEEAKAASAGPTIPAPAPAGEPAILRADRAYQIAAAHFYAGRLDLALAEFKAIADNRSSPWSGLAGYLAARTLVRMGTLLPGSGQIDKEKLTEAVQQLQAMLANRHAAALHSAARRLRDLARLKLDPELRLHELALLLTRRGEIDDLGQNVKDYTVLLDKYLMPPESDRPPALIPFNDAPVFVRKDVLTDWIVTFQSPDPPAAKHAIQEWKKDRSLPWLVAALSKIQAGDPNLPAILAAAAVAPHESPAYLTVSYHRIRLEMASGNSTLAVAQLDKLLAGENWKSKPSGLNLFLAQRMRLAQNLNEFLKFAPRVVSGFGLTGMDAEYVLNPSDAPRLKDVAKQSVLLNEDSARVLNEALPLNLLVAAANSNMLSPYLHQQIARAVWVRAFLLGREDVALRLAAVLAAAEPDLKPDLVSYETAGKRPERDFAAINTILTHPGMRPYVESGAGRRSAIGAFDNFHDNWWCKLGAGMEYDLPNYVRVNTGYLQSLVAPPYAGEPDLAPFLTPRQKAEGRQELGQLSALGSATDFLGSRVIAWARSHPDDKRLPQALHIVVMMPHTGCSDARTASNSRIAFQLLHRLYPGNPWTKKTRYWYH